MSAAVYLHKLMGMRPDVSTYNSPPDIQYYDAMHHNKWPLLGAQRAHMQKHIEGREGITVVMEVR